RALASRRALLAAGVPEGRVDRVVGRADTDPLLTNDPKAPRNRRISIILMRENDLAAPPEMPASQMPPPAPKKK
ncbi:MAG TPA: hypothetical protein VK196_20300, partial [Magnetospirillum sp.]|nr:hypothetical protein [Magnetospirillum sp.]